MNSELNGKPSDLSPRSRVRNKETLGLKSKICKQYYFNCYYSLENYISFES